VRQDSLGQSTLNILVLVCKLHIKSTYYYDLHPSSLEGPSKRPSFTPRFTPTPVTVVNLYPLKVDVGEKKIRLSTMPSRGEGLDVPTDNDDVRRHGWETGPKEFGRYY
jgi:hypothetical protein